MPRGGKRPNSGGKRPGAGRKPKPVEEFRLSNQMLFAEVPKEDARSLIRAQVRKAVDDQDTKAFLAVAPYIFGPAPKELTVKGDAESPVEVKRQAPDVGYVAEVLRVLAEAGVFEAGPVAEDSSTPD